MLIQATIAVGWDTESRMDAIMVLSRFYTEHRGADFYFIFFIFDFGGGRSLIEFKNVAVNVRR